ncbi:hypothetical protein, partial [Salinispira pacifica]
YRVRGLSESDGAAFSRFLGSLSIAELESIHARLQKAAVATNREEAAVLLEMLDTEQELNGRGAYVRRLLVVMRKFAFKKYDREFREFSGVVADAVRARPVRFPGAEAPLQALIELFERRLAG